MWCEKKKKGINGVLKNEILKFWHIVGDDVTNEVLDFLNSGNMVREIKAKFAKQ